MVVDGYSLEEVTEIMETRIEYREKREKVQTVSTSVVTIDKNKSVLFHQDYLKKKNKKLHLQFSIA